MISGNLSSPVIWNTLLRLLQFEYIHVSAYVQGYAYDWKPLTIYITVYPSEELYIRLDVYISIMKDLSTLMSDNIYVYLN